MLAGIVPAVVVPVFEDIELAVADIEPVSEGNKQVPVLLQYLPVPVVADMAGSKSEPADNYISEHLPVHIAAGIAIESEPCLVFLQSDYVCLFLPHYSLAAELHSLQLVPDKSAE